MRAAIFNPYLDTLGGGERYTLAVAKTLSQKGYQVFVQWKNKSIKTSLEKRFGLNLREINFIKDIKRGDGYDLLFWLSDGSIPLVKARKNLLHFQFPFKDVNGKSLLNRMKLFRFNKIICNSRFTKKIIDEEYSVNSVVLYPPVDTLKIKPGRKENIIIYVGRFSQLTQAKHQDILIKAFKVFNRKQSDWKLILAGGTEIGAADYVHTLRKEAKGMAVEIVESPDFNSIKNLFAKAKIFWSAAGYGINEEKEPAKVEHFGITVVEAMASGAIPLVYKAGGPKEIISEKVNGYFWEKENELVKKTIALTKDEKNIKQISQNSIEKSKEFSYQNFENIFLKIIA